MYLVFVIFINIIIGCYLPCGHMSEPGDSSMSHAGNKGTQRMVEGEVDLGCYAN